MSVITPLRATSPGRALERPQVIALHCSGGSGRQWRHLAQALGPNFNLVAPDLIGCGNAPSWHGTDAVRLTDEARRIVTTLDQSRDRVHLVGHSYGGALALRVAMERPHRIASLTLYEPTSFHVLRALGADGRRASHEIRTVASGIADLVVTGRYHDAAHLFVDYWNGVGTFMTLSTEARGNVAGFMPHAVLNFHALFNEGTTLSAYRRLRVPLRIFCGALSPEPARLVARGLARAMNPGALRVIEGLGHMGPVTTPVEIAAEMANFIHGIDADVHEAARPWDLAA